MDRIDGNIIVLDEDNSDEFEAPTQQDLKAGGDGAKAHGWNVLNSANADTVDVNVTNPGKLTIDHGASFTSWGLASETGPFIYKNVTGDFDIETHFEDNADGASEGAYLLVRDPDASAGLDNIFVRRLHIGTVLTITTRNTANSASIGGNSVTASDSYLRVTRAGNVFTLYSKANAGDPWTQRAQYTRDDFAETVQVGVAAATYNTSNNYAVQFDYVRFNKSESVPVYIDENNNRKFTDGPPGTNITDDFANAVQEEIVGIIENAGFTPSSQDNTQFVQSLRARRRYGEDEDSGASNEYIINVSPPLSAYKTGLILYFLPAKDNPGSPVYINMSSLGNKEVKFRNEDIGPGLIVSDQIARVVFTENDNFELLYPGADYYG